MSPVERTAVGSGDGTSLESRILSGKPVNAAAGAIHIIWFLVDSPEPARVTDVARALHMNVSTCFNILRTLVREDMVRFDQESKRYGVGSGLAALCLAALGREHDSSFMSQRLRDLAQEFHVTVKVWRFVSQHLVAVIEVPTPDRAYRGQPSAKTVPSVLPPLTGAAGLVLAAHGALKPDELQQSFQSCPWAAKASFGRFRDDLKRIRVRGWEFDPGRFFPGLRGLAVPIYDPGGRVRQVLAVSAYRQMKTDQLEGLLCACREVSPDLALTRELPRAGVPRLSHTRTMPLGVGVWSQDMLDRSFSGHA